MTHPALIDRPRQFLLGRFPGLTFQDFISRFCHCVKTDDGRLVRLKWNIDAEYPAVENVPEHILGQLFLGG